MQILGEVQSGVEERRPFECANGSRTCPGWHPASLFGKEKCLIDENFEDFLSPYRSSRNAQGFPLAMVWRNGTLSLLLGNPVEGERDSGGKPHPATAPVLASFA